MIGYYYSDYKKKPQNFQSTACCYIQNIEIYREYAVHQDRTHYKIVLEASRVASS